MIISRREISTLEISRLRHGARIVQAHRAFDPDKSAVRVRLSGDGGGLRLCLYRWVSWRLFASCGGRGRRVLERQALQGDTAGGIIVNDCSWLW